MADGRAAVITGAGRGIGKEVALGLAKEGVNIVAVDIALGSVEETCAEARQYGVETLPVQCDVADVAATEKLIADVVKQFGHIDILVNNAGISRNIPIEEMTEEEWDRTMDINLKGVFFLSKYAFIEMKKAKYGKIINLASIAGERGGLFTGMHYSASKGGVITLTKCFAIQGSPYNINVNAVAPGVVDTEMSRELQQKITDIPMGRKATPGEVAEAIVFLASDKAKYITGVTLDVNGGQLMR